MEKHIIDEHWNQMIEYLGVCFVDFKVEASTLIDL